MLGKLLKGILKLIWKFIKLLLLLLIILLIIRVFQNSKSETRSIQQLTDILNNTKSETEEVIRETSDAESSTNMSKPEMFTEITETEHSSNADPDTQKNNSPLLVTPEFKEAMDSYEAFFDEYISFLESYSQGEDAAMLLKYTEYLSRYADVSAKLEAIDESSLNDADLLYYIEVTARIETKLLRITELS